MDIKHQIIEKTAKLFRHYGIRNNTMDDIARELGISKKTLYLHIKDKKELIQLVVDREYIKFEQRIKKTNEESENPIDQIIRLNIIVVELLKDVNPASMNDLNRHFNEIFESSKAKYQQLIFDEIISNIRKGKAVKVYREDINEELITKLHADRIKQTIDTKEKWSAMQVTPETIKEMTIYYVRGLISPAGEILLEKYMNDFNKYFNK